MSISENFGNPKGLIGRLMLSGMNMGHTPMAKWGFAQFEVPEAAVVVDIGCGGGYNVKRLLERCPRGHVFGVDISEESVKKSRAVNKSEVGKRCDIVRASVEVLPFDDHVLDLATAVETLRASGHQPPSPVARARPLSAPWTLRMSSTLVPNAPRCYDT